MLEYVPDSRCSELAFAMPRISLSTIAISQIFQSHHFTTALIELFDRLIELLYRERHVEGVSGSARLMIGISQVHKAFAPTLLMDKCPSPQDEAA